MTTMDLSCMLRLGASWNKKNKKLKEQLTWKCFPAFASKHQRDEVSFVSALADKIHDTSSCRGVINIHTTITPTEWPFSLLMCIQVAIGFKVVSGGDWL